MKKIINSSSLFTIGLITIFTSAFTSVSSSSGKELAVELKYAGGSDNHKLLQLVIAGSEHQNDFNIIIADKFGYTLYKENVKGEKIIKKFLFDTDEIGDDRLRFEVFCRKTNRSVIYTINWQSSYTENIVITEQK